MNKSILNKYSNKIIKMRYLLLFAFSIMLTYSHAQLSLSLESGFVSTQYNDVRSPNGDTNPGTLFSLPADFSESGWTTFIRAEVAYKFAKKHTVEITAVPLTIAYNSLILPTIDFANATFTGSETNATYQFNTYRASYRYGLIRKTKWTFDLGATVLVRDAEIKLTNGSVVSTDDDLGFVPLVSFDLSYKPNTKFQLLLKGDALVGPVGRAEDVFAGLLYNILDDNLLIKTGYRVIEGGADVDQVYNFALFHFVDFGIVYNL